MKTQNIQQYRKDYYANNKEKIKEYNRMWSDNNPNYYKDYAKEKRENGWTCPKITCEICGFVTHKNNLSRHQQSKKCIAISQGFKGYSKYNAKPLPHEEVVQLEAEADVPVLL